MLEINGLGSLSTLLENQNIDNTYENPDHDQLILEAALTDEIFGSALSEALENDEEVRVLNEKNIVKLDRQTRLKRATETAVFTIAREKGDAVFKKLVTLWKMEALLTKKLKAKYYTQAQQRGKKVIQANELARRQAGGSVTNMIKNSKTSSTFGNNKK